MCWVWLGFAHFLSTMAARRPRSASADSADSADSDEAGTSSHRGPAPLIDGFDVPQFLEHLNSSDHAQVAIGALQAELGLPSYDRHNRAFTWPFLSRWCGFQACAMRVN